MVAFSCVWFISVPPISAVGCKWGNWIPLPWFCIAFMTHTLLSIHLHLCDSALWLLRTPWLTPPFIFWDRVPHWHWSGLDGQGAPRHSGLYHWPPGQGYRDTPPSLLTFFTPAGIQTQALYGCAYTLDILLTKPHPHGPSFVHLQLDYDHSWTRWAELLLT